jgi:hypothetical protein
VHWRHERRPDTRGDAAPASREQPLARTSELVIEELADEVLVYDQRVHRAHCLSAAAALVWSRCDGVTRIEDLGAELGLDAATARRAVDELALCELLEAVPQPAVGTTRRELTIKLAKVGAVAAAVPLIVSVAAPQPAQAATIAFCASACPPAGCDASGNCGDCCTAKFAGCGCCVTTATSVKHCTPVGTTAATKSQFCEQLFPNNTGSGGPAHISCTG